MTIKNKCVPKGRDYEKKDSTIIKQVTNNQKQYHNEKTIYPQKPVHMLCPAFLCGYGSCGCHHRPRTGHCQSPHLHHRTQCAWLRPHSELTLGVKAYHDDFNSYQGNSYVYITGTVIDDRHLFDDNTGIAPSVGARLLLYEGKAWLPKVSFYTSVALATITGRQWTADETLVQPTIGLSFRNNLGKGWMLDYTLDFSWNRHFPRQDYYPASLSVFARWLATDRLLLSAGFSTPGWAEIFKGVFEVRYLATSNLQLTLQGGLSGGSGMGFVRSTVETNLLAGVGWMIK